MDIDTHGVRSLRMLAAGSQPQAKPGLVQQHIGHNQQHKGHQHEPVEFKIAQPHQQQILGLGVADIGGDIVAAGGCGVDGLHSHGSSGGSQHIHSRTGDGLIRPEPDGSHCQQQGEQQAKQGADQNGADNHYRCPCGGRHILQNQRAAQSTDDHDALQTDVDDTAALGKAAAQSHQHQHGSEDQGILQQQ